MWRTLDHTADVALEIEAASWEELLAEAAHAFGEWTTGERVPAGAHETERALEVHGADRVESWVRFWRELLRLWTIEGFLPIHARIESDDVKDNSEGLHVHAKIGCVSAGALDPAHCQDVKAVTWHAAAVERRGEAWVGRIVLDL